MAQNQLSNAAKLLGRKGGKIGGKIGGKARTDAKKAASKANGAKGGRPRKSDSPSFLINVHGVDGKWRWSVSDMSHNQIDGGTEGTRENAMNAACNCVTSLSIQGKV